MTGHTEVDMAQETYCIPAFTTQNGNTLDIDLVYSTHGQLSPNRDNAVIILTSYAAQHDESELLFINNALIQVSDYFVIVIDMICNGLSSSPSNTPAPNDGPRFPDVTIHDNVICQHRLVTEKFGIETLRLVMGYSMGGLQAFEWGCQHSGMVEAILPVCSAARVSAHNHLFLEGAKGAMVIDPKFDNGDYNEPPTQGLLAFGQVYAGWIFSQAFFREQAYQEMGLGSVEDVVALARDYFMQRDANDLLGMLNTWQNADISNNTHFNGDFDAALNSIAAKAIVMPGQTDLYFTVADSEIEVSKMPNAELRIIPSNKGHMAGGGMDPVGKDCIDRAIADLLT
jgi:homoserine O-acetyltransferase